MGRQQREDIEIGQVAAVGFGFDRIVILKFRQQLAIGAEFPAPQFGIAADLEGLLQGGNLGIAAVLNGDGLAVHYDLVSGRRRGVGGRERAAEGADAAVMERRFDSQQVVVGGIVVIHPDAGGRYGGRAAGCAA
ncbi:hypothetical protein SDC9_146628 [bioreactor metagenome]|uniref:Uncharacterized protein n=1 Tax=bioreactor metagenome TaxID=1076179 RepID=A0A645EBT1_9ZZZZ